MQEQQEEQRDIGGADCCYQQQWPTQQQHHQQLSMVPSPMQQMEGKNPCSCNDIVVQAAEVTKPIQYHVSPEVINEAVTIREGGKSGCSETQTNTLIIPDFTTVTTQSDTTVTNVIDNTLNPSSSISNPSITLDVPNKYSPSELTSVTIQTEPTSSDKNVQIVPSFSPVSNLCNPSSKLTALTLGTRVKVTPAYPVKMKCCRGSPYQECIKYISGIRGNPSSVTHHIGTPIGLPQSESGTPSGLSPLGNGNYGTSRNIYDISNPFGTPNGLSQSVFGSGSYSTSSIINDIPTPFGTTIGLPQSEFGNGGYTSSYKIYNTPVQGDLIGIPSQRRPQDQLPADPISLTLAYKNLVAPQIYYNKGKKLISEGSISFGHRTLPIEAKKEKKLIDIPEEKLVIVDKPIVELKHSPASSIIIGENDDEEDNLAELEAMERENLEQREQVNRVRTNFLSYGDVGYRPIDLNVVESGLATNTPSLNPQGMDQRNLPNGEENGVGGKLTGTNVGYKSTGSCGPIGPPLPGYIPGSIIIKNDVETETPRDIEEIDTNTYNYNVDNIEINEDNQFGPESGIIARLRNAARKHSVSSTCFK
ncbi:uncharacterized protein LOC124426502 isoform X1 [Vespa crabro]|uniref:uncharacterized protein LOC124426502 isoform X1 n=1 Tax=Vespa crabro TaxID=7445 RepID=UPI001F006339|nr:uncharacterized protein LOC124426502 isoform X1 [Vespa crabro]